jgi:isopenicillin-N N-acyltransferase-like protein
MMINQLTKRVHPPDRIPLIEARGSHFEVGREIGRQCQPLIKESLVTLRKGLPKGITWSGMIQHSKVYLEFSRKAYPQYLEELKGIAEGADAPFNEVFLSMCEGLWEDAAWQRGCTDMAARGKATRDHSTLIAHTNDLLPSAEDSLVLLKVQAEDEPEFLGVSAGGVAISAGFNAAGISLTGNQLYNNDIRPGVPRLLIVRATLASRHLSEAIDHCLLPQRASSYNNVLADSNGEVYSIEGSGTDFEPIYIENDILAHANHYVTPPMRDYEDDRSKISRSLIRHNRAYRLLKENYGKLTPDLFKMLIVDHAGYPNSICKHGEYVVTVFSIIIQLEKLRAWIGRGRPCKATFHEYQLKPYKNPAMDIGK